MARNISYGICEMCGHRTSKGPMLRHLRKCMANQAKQDGENVQQFQLRIEGDYLPMYWLDIEMNNDSKLMDLDKFLREVWLECCGHMSQFIIKDHRYLMPYDERYKIWEHEGDMDIPISNSIRSDIDKFEYEYDFGTTTYLRIRVIEKREGKKNKNGLRLLARNEPPDWECAKCDQPTTDICVYCFYESGAFCEEHKNEHGCDEEFFLPVVNSPRTGECGYDGPGEKIGSWD